MDLSWIDTKAPIGTLFLVGFDYPNCADGKGRALRRVGKNYHECLVNAEGVPTEGEGEGKGNWVESIELLSVDQDQLWALYVRCQLGGSIYDFDV